MTTDLDWKSIQSSSATLVGGDTNLSQRPNKLRSFTYLELQSATRNFSKALMIGEGGFGCVYRGSIRSLTGSNSKFDVAVKQLGCKSIQGHKEWQTEVNVLGLTEHPNIVKLVGCCSDDDKGCPQRLLVYEYLPNKSVSGHLSDKVNGPLSWDLRLRIALDVARGLTYLHEGMNFQIIFRDLKTSNILLDENWNAKLSGFGLALEGPSEGLTHVSTEVVGTYGYAAPEYISTGRLNSKIDVYSYGVVLCELITGRKPIDRNSSKAESILTEWIKPFIANAKKFTCIIDPALEGNCSIKSAMKLAAIASMCLLQQPELRPKMSEVVELVREIVENNVIAAPSFPQNIINSKNDEELGVVKKKWFGLKRRIANMKMGWSIRTPKAVKSV